MRMRMRKMNLFSAVLAVLLGLSAQNDSLVQPQEEGVKTNECRRVDITSRILEANKGSDQVLVEGDVAFSAKRNAMKCRGEDCKWTKSHEGLVEVPFTISDYFYDSERASITEAMETFQQKTCVRFVPQSEQTDFLSIESEMGCWSTIGKEGGRQVVSLSVHGCLDLGIIQHELLHALGFHHEHTRNDRDQFVRINWGNLPAGNQFNFLKMDTNSLNTPYDYSSVMHYGRTAFAETFGAETITPIPDSSVPIGQREDMSDIDILRINTFYGCNI